MATMTELQIATKMLGGAGVPFTVAHGSKHPKVRWQVDGRKFTYFCGGTSSDWRSLHNCKSDIRRMLRQAGVSI